MRLSGEMTVTANRKDRNSGKQRVQLVLLEGPVLDLSNPLQDNIRLHTHTSATLDLLAIAKPAPPRSCTEVCMLQ